MNAYQEMKKRHKEEFSNFPICFAFSDEQFENAMKNFSFKVTDTDKVINIGNGGFIKRTDLNAFHKMLSSMEKEQEAEIENDKTGDGFIYKMFLTELKNHEYGYTRDDEDTLEALGYTYEDIQNDKRLSHGLNRAKRTISREEEMER